jgi:hypothetical protein
VVTREHTTEFKLLELFFQFSKFWFDFVKRFLIFFFNSKLQKTVNIFYTLL